MKEIVMLAEVSVAPGSNQGYDVLVLLDCRVDGWFLLKVERRKRGKKKDWAGKSNLYFNSAQRPGNRRGRGRRSSFDYL
jgi:hypothetical protein